MKFRGFIARAFAILMIGSLVLAPFPASAAGADAVADAQVMSAAEMAMDAASDEMPCHQNMPNDRDACPFAAMCMALCCQGIPVSSVSLALPAFAVSRMLPPKLVQLDGVKFPPPSRPPKA
jgi:hypothetical protein